MGLFLAFLLLLWLSLDRELISGWWASLPCVGFAALLVHHESVIGRRRLAQRRVAFYERGLARLDDRWADDGENGSRFLDEAHPYSADLDIFGPASLFQLLCTARTRLGEETLADWLRTAAPPAVVRERQPSVEELAANGELRQDLATAAESVALHPELLRSWAQSGIAASLTGPRIAAACLPLLSVGALALSAFGGSSLPAAVALVAQTSFALYWRSRVNRIRTDAEKALRDLGVLSVILARVERESFAAPGLRRLRAALATEGAPPSQAIGGLKRRVDLLDARRNELFAPIAALLLWGTQCSLAIEDWRRRFGTAIPAWLDAVGELEALCALGTYRFEHPESSYPILEARGPSFVARDLAHPLLPPQRCVRNDVSLAAAPRLLIVSGSNMSGKSTLLRAIGTNLVLAQAGGAVPAKELRLSPLRLGASIRILDSLQTGTSRFYAEIKRLRLLVEMTTGPEPLLFLLDEVLSGTNSHDRRAGAAAVVRTLIQRGAIGLLTTHDLALADLAEQPELHAVNVHFEDSLEGGEMHFDYQLRPGVVRKSNALELMRAVGLEV